MVLPGVSVLRTYDDAPDAVGNLIFPPSSGAMIYSDVRMSVTY